VTVLMNFELETFFHARWQVEKKQHAFAFGKNIIISKL
jgi:hypothetical protein